MTTNLSPLPKIDTPKASTIEDSNQPPCQFLQILAIQIFSDLVGKLLKTTVSEHVGGRRVHIDSSLVLHKQKTMMNVFPTLPKNKIETLKNGLH